MIIIVRHWHRSTLVISVTRSDAVKLLSGRVALQLLRPWPSIMSIRGGYCVRVGVHSSRVIHVVGIVRGSGGYQRYSVILRRPWHEGSTWGDGRGARHTSTRPLLHRGRTLRQCQTAWGGREMFTRKPRFPRHAPFFIGDGHVFAGEGPVVAPLACAVGFMFQWCTLVGRSI